VPAVVEKYMGEINKLTGRDYKLFNYYGAPDAQRVVVAMGSACDVVRETIDYLTARGEKVGLVDVHLYRPFAVDRLLAAVPATARKIAVLDRTKEPGAAGEPLYLDVRNAFFGRDDITIVGGRYGLGSKDFTPAHAAAVYENLKAVSPQNGFTVSITDDVTFTSLPAYPADIDTTPAGTTCCKFWGMGADGTVGANKSAIKIIGDHTDLYAQAYFAYDAKKSGGLTVSHLRFGRQPIRSSYLITKADFVACHNQSYVHLYDVLAGLKPGGKFVLNTMWTPAELEANLPAAMKRYIAANGIRFYTINAVGIAQEIGLEGRINMIMQAAFFKLAGIIPLEAAVRYLKEAVTETYGKQGQAVIDMNFAAIDRGSEGLVRVDVPAAWKTAADAPGCPKPELPPFIEEIVIPMNRQEGDNLPVSAFNGREDGTFPLGLTAWEKRGVALEVPQWQPDKCIQCNQCAFVCPHAVLRPILAGEEELKKAPAGFAVRPATGFTGLSFHLAVSAFDCTGCGNCADVCPAKEKALVMKPLAEARTGCDERWRFALGLADKPIPAKQKLTVKGSQFATPLQEFSGACAGCGETPYAKLVTQLFGDRMLISNAAGCSTVWGATAPSISYATNAKGRGPAWGFSLFEDNAEYGLGMHIGAAQVRQTLAGKIKEALAKNIGQEVRAAMEDWLAHKDEGDGTRERADRLIAALESAKVSDKLLNEIYDRRDFFVKRSQWIFGGDGWAYDIGYGGLDHVLAAGEDVNALVFDTEVYSNTGGQASKATPTAAIAQFAASGKKTRKKDLGVMMMSYGYIYVAQVAMGADKAQTLRAIAEAEAYPGPSLIIAYAPCLNHGIAAGMGKSQAQAKRAVEAGYWTLYRYNPQLAAQGKNPFVLDSPEPTASFQEFIRSEVRFSALTRQFPETAEAFLAKAEEDAKARRAVYKRLAAN
ncbi:MAG TPA: pyruvate:ferredoxin (flavodoxin) oxidoreductase, partial [Negativicutes bacterium]|nr:pyruvate:ferredoxin (flavodoxin) oxidoreductase [Negativicutes bacterium]